MSIQPKPRRLVVVDALVDAIKRTPGIRQAAHDVPFHFERQTHPFAYVYDTDEQYDVESMGMHSDNTLDVQVDVVFEWADERNRSPRVIGNRILADVLREIANDFTLGGQATNVTPQASAIRELATDDSSKLAATSIQFSVRYTHPLLNPYGENPPR